MQRDRSRVMGPVVVDAIVVVAILFGPGRRAQAEGTGASSPAAATGKASPMKYSAFDLARGKIPVTLLVPGELLSNSSVSMVEAMLDCTAKAVELKSSGKTSWLAVTNDDRTADGSSICPLFSAREPGTIKVHATTLLRDKSSAREIPIDFDRGNPFSGSTSFDGKYLHIRHPLPERAKTTMCFAYYSPNSGKWQTTARDIQADTTDLTVELPLAELSGTIYAHHGACASDDAPRAASDVTRVEYPAVVMRDLADFDCKDSLDYKDRYGANANYLICIDQANLLGQARIVKNHEHYIQTFAFGRIVIRHWRTVVPIVTIAGAGVSINQPGFAGAAGAPGPGPTSGAATAALASGGFALPVSLDGQGVSGATTDDYLVSTVFIPPHAPGAMHIDIKFVDPGDAKPRAATAIDLAVDQGYSGSLRLGIAHVFGAQDHRYSKLQTAPSLPGEIVRSDTGANEVVIGYSLYLDGLLHGDPAGRTYAVYQDGWYWPILRHLGLFAGFGALNYSPGNIDFLKSVHLGVELELTRNFSLAFTYVGRRITQLDDHLHVGGLAPPGDLPTSNSYSSGFGVVFNFSTDFAKFATAAPTTGASK